MKNARGAVTPREGDMGEGVPPAEVCTICEGEAEWFRYLGEEDYIVCRCEHCGGTGVEPSGRSAEDR